jgi:hypothetical protein
MRLLDIQNYRDIMFLHMKKDDNIENCKAVETLKSIESLILVTDTGRWISHDQRIALLKNIEDALK